MSERYREKVRKLLALAQSDNPHEAERAKIQAQKLMEKHNIHEGDIEIITTQSKPLPRKNLKQSEAILLAYILRISACEGFTQSNGKWKNDRYSYTTTPNFMGLQHDAELAAYSWDVLYTQMLQAAKIFKKEHPNLGANEVELYSQGWAQRAAQKLVNVFGERKPERKVSNFRDREHGDLDPAKPRKAKSSGDEDLDELIAAKGYRDRKTAQLHNATSDQREKQFSLEHNEVAA